MKVKRCRTVRGPRLRGQKKARVVKVKCNLVSRSPFGDKWLGKGDTTRISASYKLFVLGVTCLVICWTWVISFAFHVGSNAGVSKLIVDTSGWIGPVRLRGRGRIRDVKGDDDEKGAGEGWMWRVLKSTWNVRRDVTGNIKRGISSGKGKRKNGYIPTRTYPRRSASLSSSWYRPSLLGAGSPTSRFVTI